MTDAQAAVGMDRLPWLDDELAPAPRVAPKLVQSRPKPAQSGRDLAGWAVAAVLLVAGGSFWLGTQSVSGPGEKAPATARATVKLPEAASNAQPQVPLAPVPEVETTPTPTVSVPSPPVRRSFVRQRKLSPMEMKGSGLSKTVEEQESPTKARESAKPAPAPASTASPAAASKPKPLTLWPSRETKGASGRLVRIGAFGTRQQAKLGWRKMQRAYPAVGRLPAVVVTDRNSRGRVFYRFQIGTTSQAHSEVLCQRMQTIRFSCAVVGLPWKAKVER